MKKQLVALFLVLVMLAACVPMAMADEPMTITVASYFFGPVDESRDIITPKIEEILKDKYGLNVDLVPYYIEQSDYANTLNPLLLTEDAPDVFLAQSAATLAEYKNQRVIKTWSFDFFKENAPHVWAFVEGGAVDGEQLNAVQEWVDASMIGGEMVTIPSLKPDGDAPQKTFMYRGDWLDALKVDRNNLPMTVEEFVALCERFTKEDPDGNSKNDTYGCSITGIRTIFGAYGSYSGYLGGGLSFWCKAEDGTLYNYDIADDAKEALKVIAKMYKDGLIDPEFAAGKESVTGAYWAISNGFVNSIYGASANASIDHYRLKGVTGPNDEGGRCAVEYWNVNGADSEFVYAPWPAGPKGHYGYNVGYATAVSESAAYSKYVSDEKLAVIFKILDAFAQDDELATLAKYGIEGVHYEKTANGTYSALMNNENLNAEGVMGVRSLYGADRPFNANIYKVMFYNDLSWANRLNYFKLPQYDSYHQDAVTVVLPSLNEYQGELATCRDEAYTAFILGERDIDTEWEDFVAEYNELGGEQLTKEANEWYANK